MMKKVILCISILYLRCACAQDYQFFSITPDIGAKKMQSQFAAIAADSQNIYILGDEVTELDSLGSNAKISIQISKFDYQGNLIQTGLLHDSSMIRPYIGYNRPFYKLNDSIYYYSVFSIKGEDSLFAATNLIKINVITGQLLSRIRIPYPINGDVGIETFAQTEIKNGKLILVFNFVYNKEVSNYIYKIDTGLRDISWVKLPRFLPKEDYYRWIEQNEKKEYEMIGESYELNGVTFNGIANLFYLKVDSIGNIIKKVDLNIPGNFYIGTGQTFTIIRNGDKTFAIGLNNWKPDPRIYGAMPYIMKTSPEFDTIYWMTKFYEYPDFVLDPDYTTQYMCKMNDGSGYVACCAIVKSLYVEPDYGALFKVSDSGDSLWLRKYQPIGWDSTRAGWMNFNQVICTPYNTLAVCARVSDRSEQVTKGWLLHVDSDGCLVPGCGEFVLAQDIASGKQKAFEIYPNPVSDKLYMLSRINSKSPLRMSLINLQGEAVLQNKINVNEGVQYIIDIPESLPSSTYILQIMDDKGKVWMSEKIIKEL